ncbi:AraC-type DNA-binding protein [Pustulibacterium marinum]|uniref:AraC-type DNA-binding protein n=1 Tax=Pustulibacterium marinum TaxID=1224947 RepID=A0A1I7IMI4_9FLAO|nr:helix-turn-helix transcriptional regulator [Pustulibacterium marinum]SFU74094.1 AraC-type DNA-binding protein [Pustulibacterium marinum]
MLLQSYYPEIDTVYYKINLEGLQSNTSLPFHVGFKHLENHIEGRVFAHQNFCIVHSKRNFKQQLLEQVSIKGAHIKIAYLKRGNIQITRINQDQNNISHGKVHIGFGNIVENAVHIPSGYSESILLFIPLDFFNSTLKKASWYFENDIYNHIYHHQKEDPEIGTFAADVALHKLFEEMIHLHEQRALKAQFMELKLQELLLYLHEHPHITTDREAQIHPLIKEKLVQAKTYIDKYYMKTPTLKFLARHILLNEMQLKTEFKNLYGYTVRSYIIQLKMEKSLELLKTYPVNEVSTRLGYRSTSHFISTFKKYYGTTPAAAKL